MTMQTRSVGGCVILLLVGWIVLASGCSQLHPPTDEQLVRGYILLLPGVESEGVYLARMISGLRDAGEKRAIDMDMWGARPFSSMSNLMNYEANRKEAVRLASKITEYRRGHPDAQISIIGYSGGGGMAIFVAEALPADVVVDRIVLMGAAISPRYDLTKALARCRSGIVNIYSELDWAQLGAGTEMFGTMDRQKTASAGYVGFHNPNGQMLMLKGVTQVPWVPAWRWLGHGGDHFGYLARGWAKNVLASYLKAE